VRIEHDMTCAFVTHADCRRHEMGEGHPECPERLDAISDHLIATRLMSFLAPYEAPLATREQLGRAHTALHVSEIFASAPRQDYLHLDPDTAMNACSLEAAQRAAGAAVLGAELALRDEARRVFCAVRPPGHHATRDRAMGFCIFNNVAVGIRHALDVLGLSRVALIDFDAHHGNGSEDILASDERVLMVSTFQRDFYPFLGDVPRGENMVNVGLPAGADGEALRRAFNERWLPALDAFRPQLVFVSAGFDGHRADEMAGLRFVEDDYAWITRQIVAIAEQYSEGRIVSCLEGGYDLFHLARSAAAHVKVLAQLDAL
jgi:acetoin utilization deacetylase AcuC-like enzyme